MMDNLAGGHILSRNLQRSGSLKLVALSMIRNEVDIILPFMRHCAELFDVVMIADVQSVDGTKELIQSFRDPRLDVGLYSVFRQEKYQGALMNSLARKAFRDGADWVFLLDADEFLDTESRAALEDYLLNFPGDHMLLPWINLVPSHYGTYASFDISQGLFWSGRVSQFSKIALSSLFAANNPQFDIWEGNHAVSPEPKAAPVDARLGLPLLHVPCRSVKRFRYKISSALRVTQSKHNRGEQEGSHVAIIDKLLSLGNVERAELNYIAARYGDTIGGGERLDPDELEWPVKRMHAYVIDEPEPIIGSAGSLELSDALLADSSLVWDRMEFVRDSPVAALIEHDRIRIVPQPMLGGGGYRDARFLPLGDREMPKRLPEDMLADALSVSCLRVKAQVFSAWSTLIPILFVLFSVLRPRRYVELGVHNGMSFFAACQVTDHLDLGTECVAIDSWVGDEHAGIHTEDVFLKFQQYLKENYARQSYIKAYFSSALPCFDDGSIDLLHIDGLHTYEAVKEDFETWLPKMSDCGVIIFHDINVYERGFGVWRLWEELRVAYPSYSFFHSMASASCTWDVSRTCLWTCCARCLTSRDLPWLCKAISVRSELF